MRLTLSYREAEGHEPMWLSKNISEQQRLITSHLKDCQACHPRYRLAAGAEEAQGLHLHVRRTAQLDLAVSTARVLAGVDV